MKIVVIGGFGFVGGRVIEHLSESGYASEPVSRRTGFDLLDAKTSAVILRDLAPDIIINCAAHVGSLHYVGKRAADVLDDNLRINMNLYKAVHKAAPDAHIINPVSNCSYPGNADLQVESEYWDGPVHPSVLSFASSKRMLITISDCYRMQYGIRTTNFIVPNSYGPGDTTDPDRTHALNGLVIRMLQAQASGQSEFEIWGSGSPVREWIFVRDIARVFAEILTRNNFVETPVNIGQKCGHSIKEIALLIKDLTAYSGRLVFNTRYQDGDPVKVLDDAVFREKFPGFIFTGLREGVQETIEYYKQEFKI